MLEELNFKPMTLEEFNQINTIFEKEDSVSNFVRFSYSSLVVNGIFYKGVLIGLFTLDYFIENTIAIAMAFLKEYRGLGFSKLTYNKIVKDYGKIYKNRNPFVLNIDPKNTIAIQSLKNSDWYQTYAYDEIMIEEGAEYFYIFCKENPYSRKRMLDKND